MPPFYFVKQEFAEYCAMLNIVHVYLSCTIGNCTSNYIFHKEYLFYLFIFNQYWLLFNQWV